MNDRSSAPWAPLGPLVVGTGLTVVGLVTTGAVRAVARIAADLLFGVPGLALITAALSVATIATIVGPAGLSAGITKFISQLRGEGRPLDADRFAGYAALASLALSLLGAAGAAWYGFFEPAVRVGGPLGHLSVVVLTLAFGAYLTGKAIAYGEGTIRRYVLLELAGATAFVVALATVAVLDAPAAVALTLAAAYLPVGWLGIRRLRAARGSRAGLPLRSFAGYGVVGAVGAGAGMGFTYVTPLVAGALDPITGVALVGAVLTVLEPLGLLPRSISLVLLPELSSADAAGRRSEAAAYLARGTGLVAAAAAPVCALLVLERDRVLQLVFSETLVGGATLGWFAAAFFVSVVGAPAVTALAALRLRDASISMWSSLAGFGVAGVAWVTLGPTMGTPAVALGYAVGSVIQVAVPIGVATVRYRPAWTSVWVRIGTAMALVALADPLAPSLVVDGLVVAVLVALFLPELRLLLRLVRRRRA